MKERILDIAAQLIQQHGLRKFTVDEIAAKLRISKKTIYQYFDSKEDIIRQYFETTITSDKDSVKEEINNEKSILEKIHSIVYSNHRYRLSVTLLSEAKSFYPDEWAKIEELKQFKLDILRKLLKQAAADGILKTDIHFGILSKMIEEISDMFLDYDFLLENKLTTRNAIDEALTIIFNGILNQPV